MSTMILNIVTIFRCKILRKGNLQFIMKFFVSAIPDLRPLKFNSYQFFSTDFPFLSTATRKHLVYNLKMFFFSPSNLSHESFS